MVKLVLVVILMSKTIKQIADELGVTKQAVHQKRKNKELSTALQSFTTIVDGIVYISVDGERLIKQAFANSNRKPVDVNESSTDCKQQREILEILQATISSLQGQLEIKDKQIEQLTTALENTTTSLQASQALHAGTIQNQISDVKEKKGWQFWKKH